MKLHMSNQYYISIIPSCAYWGQVLLCCTKWPPADIFTKNLTIYLKFLTNDNRKLNLKSFPQLNFYLKIKNPQEQ
jgi:hypothetical protein